MAMILHIMKDAVGMPSDQRAELLATNKNDVWVRLCGTSECRTIHPSHILAVELDEDISLKTTHSMLSQAKKGNNGGNLQ